MIEPALDRLLAAELTDDGGEAVELGVLPGMSSTEIADAERTLGYPYPPAVRALLTRTRGLDGLLEEIDFAGLIDGQALDELFPHTATIAADGMGNFWAVDLLRVNEGWGPIWYLSHDPPVALLQCDTLASFLDELVRMHTPPYRSLIDDVHEDRLYQIGRSHRGALSIADARAGDAELAAFAAELDDSWTVVDARLATPGEGIGWGRFGARTELRRSGTAQLFAYRAPAKRGLLSRIRG